MQYFRGEREANGSRDNPQPPGWGGHTRTAFSSSALPKRCAGVSIGTSCWARA
ncbi:MAG: hypothetical protein JWM45_4103 [Pseudonocardiales bacterium]|jgi:hypothetical protein|nr:hypothetical protein [Pseudonocardiales bacterium]